MRANPDADAIVVKIHRPFARRVRRIGFVGVGEGPCILRPQIAGEQRRYESLPEGIACPIVLTLPRKKPARLDRCLVPDVPNNADMMRVRHQIELFCRRQARHNSLDNQSIGHDCAPFSLS